MQRRDSRYSGQRMLMQVQGRCKRETSQSSFMDVVTEDTERVGVTEEDVRDHG